MSDSDQKSYLKDGKLIVLWKLDDGRIIHLQTPEELLALKKGTELYSIFGERVVTGKDSIDDDTRGGRTAYGLLVKP